MKLLPFMTEDEKMQLIDRVEKWNEAYPALRASVTSWQDAPVKDVDEGLLLCSCLRQAKSFVKNAYHFNAVKCLDMIKDTLGEVMRAAGMNGPRTVTEIKTKKYKAFVPKKPAPDENGQVRRITEKQRKQMEEEAMNEEQAQDKYRPQNLSGYIHLLPKELQTECNSVKQKYYMPMREYRSRLESLVENPDATDAQRKEMAAKLVEAEEALANFWQRVDKEYRIATGQTLPEDAEPQKRLQDYTKEDIDAMPESPTKQSVIQSRIENNKKYIRRQDLPDNEETRQQLLLRATELREWGIRITPRQLANLTAFGVSLPEPAKETAAPASEPLLEAAPLQGIAALSDPSELEAVKSASEPFLFPSE